MKQFKTSAHQIIWPRSLCSTAPLSKASRGCPHPRAGRVPEFLQHLQRIPSTRERSGQGKPAFIPGSAPTFLLGPAPAPAARPSDSGSGMDNSPRPTCARQLATGQYDKYKIKSLLVEPWPIIIIKHKDYNNFNENMVANNKSN